MTRRGYPYPKLGTLRKIPEDDRRRLLWWGRPKPITRVMRRIERECARQGAEMPGIHYWIAQGTTHA